MGSKKTNRKKPKQSGANQSDHPSHQHDVLLPMIQRSSNKFD